MNIWGNTPEKKVVWTASVAAIVYAVGCFLFGFLTMKATEEWVTITKFVLWTLWTVLTPAWFLFEFTNLYKDTNGGHAQMEYYKHTAEAASKIWIAVATAMGLLFAGKDILENLGKAGGKHG